MRDARCRCRKQRLEELVDECRRAVVGVERGQARIARRDDVSESGQRARPGDRVAGSGERVIWTIPSDPASANPRSAALRVSDEVTLTDGYAYPPACAWSSISRY